MVPNPDKWGCARTNVVDMTYLSPANMATAIFADDVFHDMPGPRETRNNAGVMMMMMMMSGCIPASLWYLRGRGWLVCISNLLIRSDDACCQSHQAGPPVR